MSPSIWISLLLIQFVAVCMADSSADEPLGRNYRKNYNSYSMNSHSNNGKILSTSDTKISSVSYRPNESKFNSYSDNSNLKTAASEEEKFSIGLGVLSPSYSKKFGDDGKTKLDFNSDKGGFSYSLTNVVHPHQPGATSSASLSQGTAATSSSSPSALSPTSAPIATNTLNKVQSAGFIPSAYYNQPSTQSQPSPQVNIYHKQSADPNQAIYGRLATNNGHPLPPTNNYSPAGPETSAPAPQSPSINYSPSPAAGNPYAPYNPYSTPISGPQPGPFNAILSDAEKPFLQTVPQAPPGHIVAGHHQHTLPQPLSASSQQQPATQSLTQPKLVAQQQLTANPNPANIDHHNSNYGPYSPYGPPNPYAGLGGPNPYSSNPLAAGAGYPGLLNMAASQQYPMSGAPDQMGHMNYDYLNEPHPFMY